MPIAPKHPIQGSYNPAMMRQSSPTEMWLNYSKMRPPEGLMVSGTRRMQDAQAQKRQDPNRLLSGFRTISGYPR